MSIQCIALDLDRTTLGGEGRLSPGNREALERAIERGVHIVIASGRAFATLPQEVVSIPGIEYAITSNGAAVYHVPTGTCLHSYAMTPPSVRKILRMTAEEPVAYEVFVAGRAYAQADYVRSPTAFGATPQAVEYVRSTRHPVEDIRSFIRRHIAQLDSMDIVVCSEADKRRIWTALAASVPDIYITSSVRQLIELSHRDAGKHSGVRYVAELLRLRPEEIAAFGDGDNDVEMLSYVGCGIAMANATAACKAAARHITRDYREDGVAYGFSQILKI
ncbi:Cof-type HAD-IIB family hydrolase [Dysosmobacter sp.]